MKRILYLSLLLTILLLPLHGLAAGELRILYDGSSSQQGEFASDLKVLLSTSLPDVKVVSDDLNDKKKIDSISEQGSIIVSVGRSAARKAAAYRLPTINILITRRAFSTEKENYTSPVTALYLEQPVVRHLQLIKTALPAYSNLTVLLSKQSQALYTNLKQSSVDAGVAVRVLQVDGEYSVDHLFENELTGTQILLLLPDPDVVNHRTVKPLIVDSYRHRIPLMGYSRALVKAGALMAVHSSWPYMQQQVLEMVKDYIERGRLPSPAYPVEFEVSVNYQLARALKLRLPAEEKLYRQLKEQLQ